MVAITAERLAHTLKGLAGNIGALSLQQQAEQLEAALHATETAEKLNAILISITQQLSELIAALKIWQSSTEDKDERVAEVDRVKLQTVVLRLANLLADDDAESTDYLAKHDKLLNKAFPTQFTSLQKLVGDYDFAGALNTLKQAAAQWQIIW